MTTETNNEVKDEQVTNEQVTDAQDEAKPAPKRLKKKDAPVKGARKVKSGKDVPIAKKEPDLVTLREICDELKLDPYVVRQSLRAQTAIAKPAKVWSWPKGDRATIKKAIAAMMK